MNPVSILRPAISAGVLALVLGMGAAVAAPLVYVPLGGKDRIVVVDAAKDQIVATIDGITAVHGLARTPDGQFLIAGSLDEREAGSAPPEKPAGMSADEHAKHHGMAPAPKQKPAGMSADEHAAHHGMASAPEQEPDQMISTVSVIRAADRSIVRRIDVPGAVHHVAVSPDGRFAVVTLMKEGGISAIDLATYEVVATVPTGTLPNYAVFSPDGRHLYVSNGGDDTVSEVDTARWTVAQTIKVASRPEHMAAAPDGRRLYVANVNDGTVSEIAADSGTVTRTFEIGGKLHGLDVSNDGTTLFVSARERNKLVAVDLRTGDKREIALDPAPYHLTTIGDTGKLYISSAEEPIVWVVDQKDLAVLGTIPIGGKGHQMVPAPGS